MTTTSSPNKNPLLVLITGPTASGKSALSVAVARALGAPIVSFDSRQLYREMCIGTAKPSVEEQDGIPHWGIDLRSIHEPYSAGDFQREASEQLKKWFQTYPTVVAVGGSTLYYDALTKGFDNFPTIGEQTAEQLDKWFEAGGLDRWCSELQQRDPETFATIDLKNPRRVQRALEVSVESGRPYASFINNETGSRDASPNYRTLSFAPLLERSALYERINQRVIQMVEAGLEEEARALYPFRNLRALDTVGYREWWPYFEGEQSVEEVTAQIQQNTRRYAKRQLTWFRKKQEIKWVEFKHPETLIQQIHEKQTT